MSRPIPMRAYVTNGLVNVETVNSLLQYGEPMVSERLEDVGRGVTVRSYHAWLRRRAQPCGCTGGRVEGRPDLSLQFAADWLLEKLRGER